MHAIHMIITLHGAIVYTHSYACMPGVVALLCCRYMYVCISTVHPPIKQIGKVHRIWIALAYNKMQFYLSPALACRLTRCRLGKKW